MRPIHLAHLDKARPVLVLTRELVRPHLPTVTVAPITTTIDIGKHLETKMNAFKAHVSQEPLWARFEDRLRKLMREERFHLAASVKNGGASGETDLLAGVTDD